MISNMKRNLVIAAIMTFGLANAADAVVTNPQQERYPVIADFKNEPAFLQDYMKIKNALVKDDYAQVKRTAMDMQKSLEEVELNKEQHNSLKDVVANLAKAENIGAQRRHFAQLSQHVYQIAGRSNPTDETLYLQSCGMAMGGQGAVWLSYDQQIKNPFMGQKMSGCGSVIEKTER